MSVRGQQEQFRAECGCLVEHSSEAIFGNIVEPCKAHETGLVFIDTVGWTNAGRGLSADE